MNHGEGPWNEQGPKKERETKDDARYIIFYTFADDDEVGEREPLDKEGATS